MKITKNDAAYIIDYFATILYEHQPFQVTPVDANGAAQTPVNALPIYKFQGFEKAPVKTCPEVIIDDTSIPGKKCILIKPYKNPPSLIRTAVIYNLKSYHSKLNNKNRNKTAPSFINIPKSYTETKLNPLLITPALNGESIIVVDHNKDSYRVFFDERPNSSTLYDNYKVVFALDALDYQYDQDPIMKTFSPKKEQNIRFFATFSLARNKWEPLIYHDVGGISKPYIQDYQSKTSNGFDSSYDHTPARIRVEEFKLQTFKELESKIDDYNGTLPPQDVTSKISIPQNGINNLTGRELYSIAHAYRDKEATRIKNIVTNTPIETRQSIRKMQQNYDFFKTVQSVGLTKLYLEDKAMNTPVVTIFDETACETLVHSIGNEDEKVQILTDFYFDTEGGAFITGYETKDDVLHRKHNNPNKNEIFNKLTVKNLNNQTKGELVRLYHLATHAQYNLPPSPIMKDAISADPKSSTFFGQVDFTQKNIIGILNLYTLETRGGVCYALSLLKSFSNEPVFKDAFLDYFSRPDLMSADDITFLNRLIKALQLSQLIYPLDLDQDEFTPNFIKQSFKNDDLKSIILANNTHATSLCKVFNSNGTALHYEFFDPNYGFTSNKDLDILFPLIEKVHQSLENCAEYRVIEVSSKSQKNYAKINGVTIARITIRDVLGNMKNNKRLHPGPLLCANAILSNPHSDARRIASHLNYVGNVIASTINDPRGFPILESIRVEKDPKNKTVNYFIKRISKKTKEQIETTIKRKTYDAIKFLNDKRRELQEHSIRWDNKLGKFIGVDNINKLSNNSSKIFAFISLVQFIYNRLTGEVIFDDGSSELRDFITAQIAVDLSAEFIDVGTDLVAPSINFAKHYYTGSGFKHIIGANFLKTTNLSLSVLGLGLSIASLGLSIKILSEIDMEKDPTGFAMALGNTIFAGVGVVLSTGAFLLGAVGMVALAGVFMIASVVVGAIGLIVGAISFFMSLNKAIVDDVQSVANFFKSLDEYKNKIPFEYKDGVFVSVLPISEINYNTGDFSLGEYMAAETLRKNNNQSYGHSSGSHIQAPHIYTSSDQYKVDMFKAFGIVQTQQSDELKNQSTVLLPAIPNLNFGYKFTLWVSDSISEKDLAFGEAIHKSNTKFKYTPKDPGDYKQIISKLIPQPQKSELKATLCPENKVIIVPTLNNDDKATDYEAIIDTIVTPSSEHKELTFLLGLGANLNIRDASAKIKYTFDFSSLQKTKVDLDFDTPPEKSLFHDFAKIIMPMHSFARGMLGTVLPKEIRLKTPPEKIASHIFVEKQDGSFLVNNYTTLRVDSNSLENDSFMVKDLYEQYSYNVKTKQKTIHIADARVLNKDKPVINEIEALALLNQKTTAPEVLVNRITSNNKLTFGLYVKRLKKLFTSISSNYITDLSLDNHTSGGFYLEDAGLVYFYSYKQSIIWAINEKGELQQIFSLDLLKQSEDKKIHFYRPTSYDYKLVSVAPLNDGVVAKYIQYSDGLNHIGAEISVFCNTEGMDVLQTTMLNNHTALNIKEGKPLGQLITGLTERGEALIYSFGNDPTPSSSSTTQRDKTQSYVIKIRQFVNEYINVIVQSMMYEGRDAILKTRVTEDKCILKDLPSKGIKFSNLFYNYDVTNAGFTPFRRNYLNKFNALEKSADKTKDLFFAITNTQEKADIMKPICLETDVVFLGQSKQNYFLFTREGKGRIYVQRGSGSGLDEVNDLSNIDLLIQNFSDTYKDVRFVADNLILTTLDGSIISYNEQTETYTLVVSNTALPTSGTVPNKADLKGLYPNYEFADFLLLNKMQPATPDLEVTNKVYIYHNTYLILNLNHTILHAIQDDKNEFIHHIWYATENTVGKVLLKKISVDLRDTLYNEATIINNTTVVYSGINKDYNELGFSISSNTYKFIPNDKGIELINQTTLLPSMTTNVVTPTLVSGYHKLSDGTVELDSFIINRNYSIVPSNLNKNLRIIGTKNKDVYFLNTETNRIMVSEFKSLYGSIVNKYSDANINLFDSVNKVDNTIIYNLKKDVRSHLLELDTHYAQGCSSALIENITGSLGIKFKQDYMSPLKIVSISDMVPGVLSLEFPNIARMMIVIEDDSVYFKDSVSEFCLVLPHIFKATPRMLNRLNRNKVILKGFPASSGETANVVCQLSDILNWVLAGRTNDTTTFIAENLKDYKKV